MHRPQAGIFISHAVTRSLPLYCRTKELVRDRLKNAVKRLGADVVHVKFYDIGEPVVCPGDVNLIVIVALHKQEQMLQRVQGIKVLSITLDSELSLHAVLA